MLRKILDPCHKPKPKVGILNKSETNPTIQQGQEQEINSHTPEQNTPLFCKTRRLMHLLRAAYNQFLQKPIDPIPHLETLIFQIHFPTKIPSMIKLLIASGFFITILYTCPNFLVRATSLIFLNLITLGSWIPLINFKMFSCSFIIAI